ncbi:uncharacterized protein PAC_12802 [Phialocephala subalpina]|uniref:DUF6604 domain-containing protein n=1 Tax=Phialocephala subalpina TaxID=576137 RepID=A0A1L7XD02_9HELO|nr:uncharacterized protein PAC_12802 [Phialocephala subalpina]
MNDLDDKVEGFVNSFDGLIVEDIDACSDDDSTSSQAPKRKSRPPPKVHYKSEKCIQKLWKDYQDGKIDLMNVSIVTDNAFDLMDRPKKTVKNQWYLMALPKEPAWDDEGPRSITMTATNSMKNLFKDTGFKRRPTRRPMRQMNQDRMRRREWKRILSSLKELVLKGFPHLVWSHDKFCKSIQNAIRERFGLVKLKPVPIWLVFATQTFLDIHHILQDDGKRGFEDLSKVMCRTYYDIRDYNDITGSGEDELWTRCKKTGKTPNDVFDFFHYWVVGDRQIKESQLPYVRTTLSNVTLSVQEIRLRISNYWGSTVPMAHLYNAARQNGYCAKPWPDMEKIIEIHGEVHLFVGNRPTDVESICARYLLSHRAKPHCAAAYREAVAAVNTGETYSNPTHVEKPTHFRQLEQTCSIASIFYYKYACEGCDPRLHVTLHDIEKLMTKSSRKKKASSACMGRTSKEGLQQFEPKHGKDILPQITRLTSPRPAEDSKQTDKLSPTELLESLSENLAEEHTKLNFNYISVHLRSLTILRLVEDLIIDDVIEAEHPEEMIGEFGRDDLAELYHINQVGRSIQQYPMKERTESDSASPSRNPKKKKRRSRKKKRIEDGSGKGDRNGNC